MERVDKELRELFSLLEERLVQHDNNRKEIQRHLQDIHSKILEEADLLEEKLNNEIRKEFEKREEHALSLNNKLNIKDNNDNNVNNGEINKDAHIKRELQKELSSRRRYEIEHVEGAKCFSDSYRLKIICDEIEAGEEDHEPSATTDKLEGYLNRIWDSMIASQNRVAQVCSERRTDAEKLEKRINEKLESLFIQEDARIQGTVTRIREKIENGCTVSNKKYLIRKARMTLAVRQNYSFDDSSIENSFDACDLVVTKRVFPQYFDLEEREPTNFTAIFTDKGMLSVSFALFSNDDDEDTLKPLNLPFTVFASLWRKDRNEGATARTLTKEYTFSDNKTICFSDTFAPLTTYCLRVRAEFQGLSTPWSDCVEFTTPEFRKGCTWRECPSHVNYGMKYSIDGKNPRIATKNRWDNRYSTIIANMTIPLNAVTSWSIKVLESESNDANELFIGVSPSDIDQNEIDNSEKCGWYYDCYDSTLWSGPPHNYSWKKYGPKKGNDGEYVHKGDSVGVVIDTKKGGLSFVLNNVNHGAAYEGVPLDKPLVPCVLFYKEDSIELDLSEVNENAVDSSIPVLSNIIANSITWDSIVLTWNEVENASFYQIEVDGEKLWDVSTANSFTKRGLLPETEHVFRVRTVRGSSVSEWGDAVKGRTPKAPEFSECAWKECPDDVVDENMKYRVDEKNNKIATKNYGYDKHCTIMGNTLIPPSSVTSWSIKILKEKWDDGYGIFVGAAPSDIDQNIDDNSYRCGWYFHCYDSTLWSGPPHNYYKGKKYVFKKEVGQYVCQGESVGVVMDTTKGELSFVLNDVNLGVAFEGIPLDKPLVPCVLLENEGDSVELVSSAIKEIKTDSSIPIPSNTAIKSLVWDSITLTWDKVVNASFYQIEMNGSKYWDTTMINSFTKSGLLLESECSFRVRTVRGSSVSEWSEAVKGRIAKAPEFSECAWKECPADVDEGTKYAVDEKNPRIATKINNDDFCTVINNSPFPLDTVISWSVKVLKSRNDNGYCIQIGVAPPDINQDNIDFNSSFNECGWYFDCHSSTLWSGPPHDYRDKAYGPRKEKDGQYVHTGDSIGVVMDTAKGELSFVLNGVNLGIAFEGIPLDKPLVPCVFLWFKGDSVELLT